MLIPSENIRFEQQRISARKMLDSMGFVEIVNNEEKGCNGNCNNCQCNNNESFNVTIASWNNESGKKRFSVTSNDLRDMSEDNFERLYQMLEIYYKKDYM